MAEPLKNQFDEAVVRRIGGMLRAAHYPGRHRIDALVNGRPVPVGHVDVVGT